MGVSCGYTKSMVRLQVNGQHPSCKWEKCIGLCRPIDGKSEKYVMLSGSKLEAVGSFHYELYLGGGCELTIIARKRATQEIS